MLKKIGILSLMLSAGMAVLPKAVFAQDGYYAPRNNHYQSDRDGGRHEASEWRERERRDPRAKEWQERGVRERDWRERDHRDRREAYFGSDYLG